MTQRLRTFLAIELPDSTKGNINDHIQTLRSFTKSSIKWVAQDNLHITMKFLGEFDPSHINKLHNLLTHTINSIPVFKIHIDRMGAFPNLRAPKVIWLGFNMSDNLRKIYRCIEESVVNLGYDADDRPFSPHLTIGRIRRDLPGDEIRNIGEAMSIGNFNLQSTFLVERVVFFQSELKKEGPIYSKLFEIFLDTKLPLC
ncbi:MAG: RNA 2',3'-cyclic phosphodiesterase [Chloroflexi bacterium]|nr:RNA 2',3'-cyclic phosphodiesterase [Chloroflexota bacterium]